MEQLMEYFPVVLAICGTLSIYSCLLFAKVVIMKIDEDALRQLGDQAELRKFLKKKTVKHILTLGLLT